MASYYVVVGAGITGLVAAHGLARRGLPVLLIERGGEIGGLLRVTTLKGASVPVELYYHAVFAGETHTLSLIDELGLGDRLEWSRGTSGCLCGNRVYRVSTPIDLLKYRPLTLGERIRVGLLTLQMQHAGHLSRFDNVTAREFVTARAGEAVYRKFFEPLMRAKFADEADAVAASWLISRIRLRKQRGDITERLGYLRGGFSALLDVLEQQIVASGGIVRLNSRIESAEIHDGRVTRVRVDGQECDVTAMISTIPPSEFAAVLKPENPLLDLCDLPYQGSVCVLVALDRSLTGVWWTNVMDGDRRFSAIVEHTQISPVAEYGSHIHYLASYPDHHSPLFNQPADETFREYFVGLRRAFPEVSERNVIDYRVAVDRHSALIPRAGVAHRIRALGTATSIENLFLAGLVNSYPERSINASVARARECVAAVLAARSPSSRP